MIVKEGREYIVNNGLKNSLQNIKVYFDNDQNITIEDRTLADSSTKYMYALPTAKDEETNEIYSYIEVLETNNKISKKECSTVLINNSIPTSEGNSILIPEGAILERGFSINYDNNHPLDIKFTVNGVKIENLKDTNDNSNKSISISSLMLVIEDGGKNILLSRVVFPTRTLNGNTTALNFEYHLYF